MRRTLLLLALSGVLLCACGSPAESSRPGTWHGPGIAFDHRIGAVSFAEAKSRVDDALGRGKERRFLGERFIFYSRARIYVAYVTDRGKKYAFAIATRSPRYETEAGVGVGSSVHAVRRLKVTCYPDYGSVPNYCQHQGPDARRLLTVFGFDPSTKRVSEVYILAGH